MMVRIEKQGKVFYREAKVFAYRSAAESWDKQREFALEDPPRSFREQPRPDVAWDCPQRNQRAGLRTNKRLRGKSMHTTLRSKKRIANEAVSADPVLCSQHEAEADDPNQTSTFALIGVPRVAPSKASKR
jgi:hypothetical protein